MKDIEILIPTFNEEDNIETVINELNQNGFYNITLLDANSTDKTVVIGKKYNCKIILDNDKIKGFGGSVINGLNKVESDSILYVKVNDFKKIENLKTDLITNFFSFGEMKRESFKNYYDSYLLNNSKYIYLINRVVSSPFFEKTYELQL